MMKEKFIYILFKYGFRIPPNSMETGGGHHKISLEIRQEPSVFIGLILYFNYTGSKITIIMGK